MLPNPTKDIKYIVKYVLIAVAVAIVLRFIIKNAKKINAKIKAKQSANKEAAEAAAEGYSTTPKFGDTLHEKVAIQLDNAFSGLGTDENSVYNAYGVIATGTPGDMIAVRAKFTEITGDDLFKETRDELTKDELSNVRGILSNYPSKFRP
jgi:hypothetical protein